MLLPRGLKLSISSFYFLLAGNLRTVCHEIRSVYITFFMGVSQVLLKTLLHNKEFKWLQTFHGLKIEKSLILPKIVSQIFYVLIHTLSYASSCLFNSREKPLYDNINTLLKKNRKHSRENLFIYLYKNGFIHKNILGKLMSWTVYNCFELSCFQSRGG